MKCSTTENKLLVEITCKEDILKAIPNTNEYYQTYHVWWAIGIACKRVGISRECFERWTGETAIGWNTWNVKKKGYGYNFLLNVARKCSNVVNGTNVFEFLDSNEIQPHITYSERYCHPMLFNDMSDYEVESKSDTIRTTNTHSDGKQIDIDTKGVVLDVPCGSGKTFVTTEIINRYDWCSILVITPRITYANSIYNHFNTNTDYNFFSYKTHDISNKDYVVCSMESLWKLKDETFSLIVIDEVESNLFQFNSPHMNKISECQSAFNDILTNADHILCLDSFVNVNRSVTLLKDMNII